MTDLGIKPAVDKDNPSYYIDKEQMRLALKKYKDDCLLAEAEGRETPRVPEYIGDCFLRIARGLGMKHNFRKYSFLNDMIGDAVITCLKGVRSYDPDMISEKTGKPTSAFSYFTQTCWFSFLNRIKEESYESSVKWSLFLQADVDSFAVNDEDSEDFKVNLAEFLKTIGPQKHLEANPKKKKQIVQEDNPFEGLE